MKNAYRADRKVLHVVLDSGLHGAVKSSAVAAGLSITEFVTQVLEKEVGYGDAGTGSGNRDGAEATGRPNGAYGGGSGAGHSVPSAAGRGIAEPAATIVERKQPDWDAILASGFAAKSVVRDTMSQRDPIEEIA